MSDMQLNSNQQMYLDLLANLQKPSETNDFESLVAQHDKVNQLMYTLKQQMQAVQKESFYKCAKAIFQQVPQLTLIRWVQYTPYFNDGEECVFSMHDVVFSNVLEDDFENISSWGEYEGDDDNVWCYSGYGEVSASVQEAYEQFAKLVDEDLMRELFGDHVMVSITANGIEAVEYEHD